MGFEKVGAGRKRSIGDAAGENIEGPVMESRRRAGNGRSS
jgi:hypothetical protein